MFVDKKTPHQMSVLSKVTCKPTAMPSKSQKSFIKHSDELIVKPEESRRGGGGPGRHAERAKRARPRHRTRGEGRLAGHRERERRSAGTGPTQPRSSRNESKRKRQRFDPFWRKSRTGRLRICAWEGRRRQTWMLTE